MITVKVTKDDSYKAILKKEVDNSDSTLLQYNIAVGFAEALKEWGYCDFEIMIV